MNNKSDERDGNNKDTTIEDVMPFLFIAEFLWFFWFILHKYY